MMMVKVTDADTYLPHQIVIMAGRTVSETSVSCNCRKIGNSGNHSPMASVLNGEGSLALLRSIYETPGHHWSREGKPDFADYTPPVAREVELL